MEPEVDDGTETIWPRVQTRGGEAGSRTRCVCGASRDLDLHENLLRKWVKDFSADPQHAFPGQGQMKPEQLEIERLRREVHKLKTERDILKKAAAYFAREAL